MQSINYIQDKFSAFLVLGLSFLFVSCGTYQYVGYDNDGIYGEEEVVYEDNQSVRTGSNGDQSVYKDYFTEKEMQYGEIPVDDNAIFTDIDSYSSSYDEQAIADGTPTGQAGWGSENENVTINFYDNGWNNWNTWGWNAGFGWGWNNWGWGWNRPWGWNAWGWNNWGWNNWGWNAGFGYGWCPPGYYYGNGFIRNNNLAYHYGRRGVNLNRNSLARRNYSNLSRRNSTVYRNRSTVRSRDNRSRSIRSRSNRSTIRPRTNTIRSSRNSSVRPRTRTTTRSRNSSIRSRNSSSSRSRSMSTSRNSSSSRGSSVRSGGSSRSSGSRGGRSSGGRRR